MNKQLARSCCLLILALTCGCSTRPSADLTGVITLRGNPPGVGDLIVSLVSAEGDSFPAEVGEDGKYSASGISPGLVRIGFVVPRRRVSPRSDKEKNGPENVKQMLLEKKTAMKKRRPASEAFKPPEKYRDPLQSGVTTILNPGPNTFNYDIK